MAKALFIGNGSNKAAKAKKVYIGDSNNKARKVKKIYIGDSNNKARLCWSSGGLDKIAYCTNKGYGYYCHNGATALGSTYEISPFMATTSMQLERISSMAYDGKGRLVCIHPNSSGNSGYKCSYYSDDGGITWKVSNFDSTNSSTNYLSQQLTYCNGYFVVPASYGSIYYSKDGINWTSRVVKSSNKFKKVVYGNGKYMIIHSSSGYGYYSTNLESGTWTTMGNSNGICEIAYGNGIFVGYDNNTGLCVYDEANNTWNLTSTEITSSYEAVKGMAFANGKFVFATNSYVAYSEDGVTWTKYNSGSTFLGNNYISSLSSNGELFFAGLSVGRIAYSSDGINWTIIDAYGTTNGTITGICGT